ncbi:MAG: flagellar basal body P-ring formation chaperone FlgA [Spirochaetia bacterium]
MRPGRILIILIFLFLPGLLFSQNFYLRSRVVRPKEDLEMPDFFITNADFSIDRQGAFDILPNAPSIIPVGFFRTLLPELWQGSASVTGTASYYIPAEYSENRIIHEILDELSLHQSANDLLFLDRSGLVNFLSEFSAEQPPEYTIRFSSGSGRIILNSGSSLSSNIQVKVLRPVFTAAREISSDSEISVHMLNTTFQELSFRNAANTENPGIDEILRSRTDRRIRAGREITSRVLRIPEDVSRGNMVTAVFIRGAVRVQARAEARTAGMVGDEVEIQLDNRREFTGIIMGEGEVHVQM